MELNFISEPELEFGQGGRHIDIRFGLMQHGPVDRDLPGAPKTIRLGLVGSYESTAAFRRWIENCRVGVAARSDTHQVNLFPEFPGFHEGVLYRSKLAIDDALFAVIPARQLNELQQIEEFNAFVSRAAEVALEQVQHLAENHRPDVIVVAMPDKVFERIDEQRAKNWGKRSYFDFHDLLKARALRLRVPLQLIWPHTYDPGKRLNQRRKSTQRRLQDPATIAWNFHSALYYKAGGTPYRLLRSPSELDTCYVGISFYRSLDGESLMSSLAQVFNQRGEGIIVRGGVAALTAEKQPYLKRDDAESLLLQALKTYKAEHRNLPARVVVHKTSQFQAEELEGLNRAIEHHEVSSADFLSLRRSLTRLFRNGDQPPLRGTLLCLDETNHVLYTKGSVEFYRTFPGMYVPKTLALRFDHVEQSRLFLASEVLALTKMNYNVTQFDGAEPITIRVAQKVADIVRYLPEGDLPVPLYRFYM